MLHNHGTANAITLTQRKLLRRLGIPSQGLVSRIQASWVISRALLQRREGPPSERQQQFLKAHGRWREGMTWSEAYDAVSQIKNGG